MIENSALCARQEPCPQRIALCDAQRRMSAESSHIGHCPSHMGNVRQRGPLSVGQRCMSAESSDIGHCPAHMRPCRQRGRLSAAQLEGRADQEATG
jgi:hypothetical protein